MTRGNRPVRAIGEAKRTAKAWGFEVIELVTDLLLPVDFAINDRGCISLVRVRRLKYAQYGIDAIQVSCCRVIQEIRNLPVVEGVYRELWVRGPARSWHRYLVLPDGIEMLESEDDREDEKPGVDDRVRKYHRQRGKGKPGVEGCKEEDRKGDEDKSGEEDRVRADDLQQKNHSPG